MNLIEQLGGYEKCKEIVNQPHADIIMNAQGLRECMLEHRRQHGIYEEGDYIIYDGELMVFAMWSQLNKDYAYIGYPDAEEGLMSHKSNFRHATDSEIAAGRRID